MQIYSCLYFELNNHFIFECFYLKKIFNIQRQKIFLFHRYIKLEINTKKKNKLFKFTYSYI